MLFRFHRGTLADSMKTVIEVNSLDELRGAIGSHMHADRLGPLNFTHQGYDDRIGWDAYLVSEVTEQYPQGCAIGHANCHIATNVQDEEYKGAISLCSVSTAPASATTLQHIYFFGNDILICDWQGYIIERYNLINVLTAFKLKQWHK